MELEIKFYTFTRKHIILVRLNSTCFDMALLLAHFWIQFLTDFHKWPFVLKLRTWSFRCTYCHDPTMVIMGPKRHRNGAENCWQFWQFWWPRVATHIHVDWCRLHFACWLQIVFPSHTCWHACVQYQWLLLAWGIVMKQILFISSSVTIWWAFTISKITLRLWVYLQIQIIIQTDVIVKKVHSLLLL